MLNPVTAVRDFCQWSWAPLHEQITEDKTLQQNLDAAVKNAFQLSSRAITVCGFGAVAALACMLLRAGGIVGAAAPEILKASLYVGGTLAALNLYLLMRTDEAEKIQKAKDATAVK